jgi:two-component sensor histidine kinase
MLREISTACVRYDITPEECLQKILDAAVVIARAQKGILQVFHPASNALLIAAQRGFGKSFLAFFKSVEDTDASSCGAALRAGARVIVDDIRTSRIFAGQPSLDILLGEDVRAVISIPLNSSHGYTLGMLSVHFCEPLKAEAGETYYLDLAARLAADYIERRKAEETERLLLAEVQHRSANLLAVVLAIARRTIGGTDRDSFEGRIQALAESNRQIVNAHAGQVQLRELVQAQTRAFAGQIAIEGRDIAVPAIDAQNLGMVVHELTTNAVKHGALRTAAGTVEISWEAERSPAETLRLRWKERGGPTIAPPHRTGFGTGLVRGLFPDADLDFAPEGLCCSLEIRLRGEDASS